MSHQFQTLLDETHDPQTFVRKSLGLLEDQFRNIALLALADWQQRNIFCADLFQAIAALQRPSWGHWNGLISALRNARKLVLRSHGPEDRQKLQEAALLYRTLDLFDERLPPTLLEALQPLATLLNQKLRTKHRIVELLTMPIAMRNRIAHDVPGDAAWWQVAEEGLRTLLAFHIERNILTAIRQNEPFPAPWFLQNPDQTQAAEVTRDDAAEEHDAPPAQAAQVDTSETPKLSQPDEIWSFNGLGQDFSVTYIHPGKRSRHRKDATQATLLAFQELLGRTGAYEGDFKKLLAKLAPEDLKGVFMGDFLVGRPVGSGGFATVHVGRQLSTGRQVAIKILHDGMDEEMAERFRQEARYLSQFRHPHIVGVHSYGEETWSAPRQRDLVRSLKEEEWYKRFSKSAPVKTYIVLEWVEGFTLEEIYQSLVTNQNDANATTQRAAWRKPDQRQIARWFAQAANALNAVHALGLIHRDVKPANLMINDKGQLKLMDFGIARSQDENRTLVTTFGHNVGTPAYMSPEQIKATLGDATLGPNTDIYSLSATFYEMFTKRRLYHHDQEPMESVQTKKLEGQLPLPPRAVVEGLPWEIETILMGGLQAEISDRYDSMEAVEQDLHRFLADEPITYKRPSLLRQLQLNYRRHTNIYRLILLFLLLVSSGLYAHMSQLEFEQKKTAKARWLAVDRANLAEREKKRALRAEAAARRAETNAKKLAVAAMRSAKQARKSQQAEQQGRQKLLVQRRKLLETQRRFLVERLQMIKQNTLKRTGAETMIAFFQEVLKEQTNPPSHQLLALRGIALVLTQKAHVGQLDTYLQTRVLNRLFVTLLGRVMQPAKTEQQRQIQRQSAFCTMHLAPYIDQQTTLLNKLLEVHSTPAARQVWAAALARDPIWLSPSAKLLSLLLNNQDTTTRMSAAGALLAMGYHHSFQLRGIFFPLQKWRDKVSDNLFMTLISHRTMEELGQLPLALLEELGDGDLQTRKRALRLLAAHGHVATPILVGALSDSHWGVRYLATRLIKSLGPPAIPHLGHALEVQELNIRKACIRILARLGPKALPHLLKALGHEYSNIASNARWALQRYVKKNVHIPVGPLLALLRSRHLDSRTYAMRLLRAQKSPIPPQARAGLWRMVAGRQVQNKYESLFLLYRTARPKEIKQHEALLTRLIAPEEPALIRSKALRVLARLGASTLAILLRSLNAQQGTLRKAANDGLVALGGSAVPALGRLLKKRDDWVCRREAAKALGRIGRRDPRVRSLLLKALQDPHDNVRYALVRALGPLGPGVLPHLARLRKDPSTLVRSSLATALRFHKEAGIPLLLKLLADTRYLVRKSARRTLARLPCPSQIDLQQLNWAQHRNSSTTQQFLRRCLRKRSTTTLITIVKSDLRPWIRSAALALLVRQYRKPVVLQTFIDALQDPSQTVQYTSATKLRLWHPPPALQEAWFHALAHNSPRIRREVLQRLLRAKLSPTQNARLMRAGLLNANEKVRHRTLRYLRHQPKESWIPLLRMVLKCQKTWMQNSLARLLGKLGASTNKKTRQKALALLRKLAWEGRTRYVSSDALRSIAAFGREGYALMRKAYQNRRLRGPLLRVLSQGKTKLAPFRELVQRSLASPNVKERKYAAHIMGRLGFRVEKTLRILLTHRSALVRRQTLTGLRHTRHWHTSLEPLLLQLFHDANHKVKREAVLALHHIKHRALAHLFYLLRDTTKSVSSAALNTLLSLDVPTEEITEAVLYALSSRYSSIRKRVRNAIHEKKKTSPALVLWYAARISSPGLRQKLWDYFMALGRPMKLARLLHHDEHPLDIATTIGWFGFHPGRHSLVRRGRQLVARFLGHTCQPDAVVHLRQTLRNDPDAVVRTQAALSLGRLGPMALAAKAELRHSARTDQSPDVQSAAAVALKRLQRPANAPEDHVDRTRNARCFRTVQAVLFGRMPFTNVP